MSLELELLHEISHLLRSQRDDIVTLRGEFENIRNELSKKIDALAGVLTLTGTELDAEHEDVVGRIAERRHSATLDRVKGSPLPSGW